MFQHTHVVAAAIFNEHYEVLIAKSLESSHQGGHQGGLWEFPVGELEDGEVASDALMRALQEEMGIDVIDARPLIRVHHDYADRSVLLDAWRVNNFKGEAHGKAGQPIAWVSLGALNDYTFLEANRYIISALQLPSQYLITPDPGHDEVAFLAALQSSLQCGIRLMQLRAKSKNDHDYAQLAKKVIELAHALDCKVLLNAAPETALMLGADGVHLDSQRLAVAMDRPLPRPYLVAASGHTLCELEKAQSIGASFALLSPVKYTKSHPDAEPMGWHKFAEIVDQVSLPVFALGGVSHVDEQDAFVNGAQGCAGIRGYWREREP